MSAWIGLAILVPLLLVLRCSTSGAAGPAVVNVRIEQLPDAGFAVEDRGATSVAYQLTAKNLSADAITLRKIEMATSGRSPYRLRDEPATLNEIIEAGKETAVVFTMWKYSKGPRSSAHEMVWVSGTVYFDTAHGPSKQSFTQFFHEP